MPLPRAVGRVVGKFLNPLVVRKGLMPILVHTGRSTGRTYRTPLASFKLDDGYMFTLNYGPDTDWVKNVLATGSASLDTKGSVVRLSNPRVLSAEEVFALLPADVKPPPAFLGVKQCLVTSVDHSSAG